MYDYIVVGAGSAGCVVAARLSEDPKRKVLLLEAGGSHADLRIKAPALYQALWRTKHDWNLYTVPQTHALGRKMYWPRGKVLGGTSALNAMVYIRGHRDDYDGWAKKGNRGWGWDDVLPYFKKSERNTRGESKVHGGKGPLTVSDQSPSAVSEAFFDTIAKRCGVARIDDFNTGVPEGAGAYQVTIASGARASTAAAFLDPIALRKNLEIRTGALVLGIEVEGDRAVGVRLRVGRSEEIVRASGEIILAAGAIGSPQILQLSGIGPADVVRRLGVDLVRELPGVGENLQDHLLAGIILECDARVAPPASPLNIGRWLARYAFGGGGPLGRSPVEGGAFVRSDPEAPRADMQFHVVPFGVPTPNSDEPAPFPKHPRFAILPGLIYPKSRGTVRAESRDPQVPPAIDPRYLSHPEELEHLVRGIHLARELVRTEPLAALVGKEETPGPQVKSDDEIAHGIRLAMNTIFHPVGTCKMGHDELAVVDDELRVRGMRGLRVADASIMPDIIGGNTNAPAIMIGEKCADFVRA